MTVRPGGRAVEPSHCALLRFRITLFNYRISSRAQGVPRAWLERTPNAVAGAEQCLQTHRTGLCAPRFSSARARTRHVDGTTTEQQAWHRRRGATQWPAALIGRGGNKVFLTSRPGMGLSHSTVRWAPPPRFDRCGRIHGASATGRDCMGRARSSPRLRRRHDAALRRPGSTPDGETFPAHASQKGGRGGAARRSGGGREHVHRPFGATVSSGRGEPSRVLAVALALAHGPSRHHAPAPPPRDMTSGGRVDAAAAGGRWRHGTACTP